MSNLRIKRMWDLAWEKLSVFFAPGSQLVSPFGAGPLLVEEPLSLFVEVTGSDSGDGSVNRPFRTIQAAADSLRGVINRSFITINVGVGSFPAFTLDGIGMEASAKIGGSTPEFSILGTLIAPTLASGTASGTVTSSSSTNARATLVDSTQNWPVDGLIGMFVTLSAATTIKHVITGNTATELYFTASTAPTVGNTYTVETCGTEIDLSLGVLGTNSRAMSLNAPAGGVSSNSVTVANIRCFRPSSVTGTTSLVSVSGTGSIGLRNLQLGFVGAATNAVAIAIASNYTGNVSIQRCLVDTANATGSTGGLFTASSSPIQQNGFLISGCFIRGGPSFTGLGGFASYNLGTTEFRNLSVGIAVLAQRIFFAPSNRFVQCVTAIDGGGTLPYLRSSTGSITLNLAHFENCTTCLRADNNSFFVLGACTGTGNTNGLVLTKGARCQIANTATLGATTELSVDGVTGTLATLRSNSPRVFPLVPNPYGTYVYE